MEIVMKDDGLRFVWRKYWMNKHVQFVLSLLARRKRALNFGLTEKIEQNIIKLNVKKAEVALGP